MDTNALLSQLKNIHQPNGVSIFPLAPGWYILTVLIICIVGGLLWWIFIKNKQKRYKLQIYSLLTDIQSSNSAEMLSDASILIKRVAIMKFPQEAVHTLFGDQWLEFLDKTGKTNEFTNGVGRQILNIYKTGHIENPDEFFACVRKWLGAVL
ncbi:MAG: hypothetical protein K0R14_428 [Burkholderiales bacterium]|jgi:hypothetical protein|nr:hypothetical protein [Burkholderiales bacterium]